MTGAVGKTTGLDFYYGPLVDARGYLTGQFGLIPYPDYLRPRMTVTEAVPERGKYSGPRLARSEGMLVLTLDLRDFTSIELTVDRLIELLDTLDGDPDFEEQHDAEPEETDHNGDEGDYSRCEDDALAGELYGLPPFGPLVGGQGL